MTNAFQLGKYNLYEIIGRGGFGTIYRAEDTVLHVPRSIKILHPALNADPVFLERFRQEARLSARLDHPNIVPVYELDQIDGSYFLVMRLMEGGSLRDLLEKDGRLPFEQALAILEQVAAGLDYAHGLPERLVHRDLKPGNILFELNGTARIADLGFAKALAGANSLSLSITGGLIGTPAYMPPEMWQDQPVSPATDIYSLGCVFFEMITGQVLFRGNSPAEIMTHHIIDGPGLPPAWPEGVPQGMGDVFKRALSANPDDRYESGKALIRAIREATAHAETSHAAAEGNRPGMAAAQAAAPDDGPEKPEAEAAVQQAHLPGDAERQEAVDPEPESRAPALFQTDPAATRLQKRPVFESAEVDAESEQPVAAPHDDAPPPVRESAPQKRDWLPWIIVGAVLIVLCCCLFALIGTMLGLFPKLTAITSDPLAPAMAVGTVLSTTTSPFSGPLSARKSSSFAKIKVYSRKDSGLDPSSPNQGASR